MGPVAQKQGAGQLGLQLLGEVPQHHITRSQPPAMIWLEGGQGGEGGQTPLLRLSSTWARGWVAQSISLDALEA